MIASTWWETNWGNVLSLLGLIVSIVGFVLTVAQVRQAKSAAEAAASAAQKARAAVLKSELLVNCSNVLSIFEELKRLHRGNAWQIALDRYSSLHQILMSLKADPAVFTEDQQTLLAGVTEQITSLERKIEKGLASGKPPSSAKLNEIIVDQTQHIFTLQTEVKSQLVSEND